MAEVVVSAVNAKAVISGASVEVVAEASNVAVNVLNGGGGSVIAADVSIEDAGGYFTSGDVEGALQEVGAELAGIVEPQSGEGITVAVDGAVNLGGGSPITGNKNVTIANNALLRFRSADGVRGLDLDDDVITVFNNSGATGVTVGTSDIDLTSANSQLYKSSIQTLTNNAGVIAWNMASGQRAAITLTASGTLQNPTNKTAAFPDLEVTQGGAGGYTLSFGTDYVFPYDYVAPPTTLGSVTLYHFQLRSDGKLAVVYTHYTS